MSGAFNIDCNTLNKQRALSNSRERPNGNSVTLIPVLILLPKFYGSAVRVTISIRTLLEFTVYHTN